MPTVRSEIQSDLTSTYYDTPDFALHRKLLTLRVRKQGRKFVQTVKAGDLAGPDLLARREWEDPIASGRPDIDAPKTGKRLPNSICEQDLRPVFATSVTRTVIEIEPNPPTRIEAAIDEGKIRIADGSAEEPISEIELELNSGDPAALFDIALRLLEAAPVRIETRSKAERGYRLLGTVGLPQAVHTAPVVLDPTMDVETALQHFGRQCFTHLLRNEPVMLVGEPEGIHQMRVAVRRLRSGLFAFATACAFFGAALYVNIVEQPARLALDARSIVREWMPSNRRGFVMLAVLAIISALSGYAEYVGTGDVRWLIGGTIILASWPYAYFVMIPVNVLLYDARRNAPASVIRELVRDWGLLEWGQTAIGLSAACMFAWILASPA
jgi:hypothetical protein